MKRVILFVLCFALMASCAWAGTLSAVYTYDDTEVTKVSSKFQIEAEREVKFTYELSSFETSEDRSIAFTNGISASMDISGDKYLVYTCTFPTSGEVGISMDATYFTPCSADITEGWGIELEPVRLTMKTSESNKRIDFKNSEKVTNWNLNLTYDRSMIQAQDWYDTGLGASPRILVSSLTSEGNATLTVKFTNKWNPTKTFERKCFITITNSGSTGSGGSGGGGCDAGLAGLGVGFLALLPFAARKKR